MGRGRGALTARDRFSSIFGNRRGVNRPEEEEPESSVLPIPFFVGNSFFTLDKPDPSDEEAIVRMYREDDVNLLPRDRAPVMSAKLKVLQTMVSRQMADSSFFLRDRAFSEKEFATILAWLDEQIKTHPDW